MAHTYFPTPTRNSRVRIRSHSTRCGSKPVRSGAMLPTSMTRYASICGRITLSEPDGVAQFAAAPGLPRDKGGPVFAEPWQAQAFALTVHLSQAGYFTW